MASPFSHRPLPSAARRVQSSGAPHDPRLLDAHRSPLDAPPMAQTSSSFDVTTGVDLQEVDNAVNQAQKEIAQRYDFKGSGASIDFQRGEALLVLVADSDFQMTALFDVLQSKLIKRGVPVKNLEIGDIKPAGGDTVRRDVKLKTALDGDTAKKVAATIKDAKLKKVQAAIQGDQVRVTSPSKDDLQEAMRILRAGDFGVELKFGNYR
jgi:cyclic-di-GMP-binding protein